METPPEETPKACPFLPPISVQHPVTHEVTQGLHPCIGEGCAIYKSCQGENSIAAIKGLLTGLMTALKPLN